MRYHFTPISNQKVQKIRSVGKGTLVHCWWERQVIKLLWKASWQLLKKIKNNIATFSAICSWYTHKMIESMVLKRYLHRSVATLFTTTETWFQPKCPSMNEWVCIMWYNHEILCSLKKGRNSAICSNMDEPQWTLC